MLLCARFLPPEDRIDPPTNPGARQELAIRSRVSGCVLKVVQKSETVLAAGSPILAIGDPANDLEIVAELLSSDAVQVKSGDRVLVEDWGGPDALSGVVRRVEPYGFTKISALGVEEQRVNAIIDFTGPKEERAGLGHGFRVDVRIVVWDDDNALVAPTSALFREQGKWAVFAIENDRARKRFVELGRNNGVQAQILNGLEAGARVVEYPGDQIFDGVRVKPRVQTS